MKKHAIAATAFAAVLAFAVTSAAQAEDAAKTENCYGVVKAGKNDCKTGAHSCAGASTADGGAEWVKLPEGVCAKIVGGSTEAPKVEEKKE